MAGFAPPPLTDAVKKVDRAVARLEELQNTIKSRGSYGDRHQLRQEQPVARQKVDVHVDRKPTIRRSKLGSGKGHVNLTQSEKEWHRRLSTTSGLVDGRVPDIVEALSSVGMAANKENAGAKKRRRKKSSALLLGLADLSPSSGRKPPQRKALESRSVNVVTEQGVPSPLSSGSTARLSVENRRLKAVDTAQGSSNGGRPPRKNVTVVSTNNRHPATIAERVRPTSATTASTQTGSLVLGYGVGQGQRRSSLPVSGRTSKAGAPSTRPPSSVRDDMDFAKTFCVDVRPDPKRPWRLAPKTSNTSRPLVMFPNPAFRSYGEEESARADVRAISGKTQLAAPKLTPFKSSQMKPLKLSSLQQPQPSILSPSATIRPYLSPSKTSPRQSLVQEEDPLAYLCGPRAAPITSAALSRNISMKQPLKEYNVPFLKKESWLSKRLSLPCSPSSASFIKRFSLLHSKQTKDTISTHSPVKPLPSLITRLPTRNKPISIDSLINMPPPRLAKPPSTSPTATPLICPLPLPPALRVLSTKPHNSSNKLESSAHMRSSSCRLHTDNPTCINDQRDSVVPLSLSSRGIQETMESFRKKNSHGLPGGNGSSVWPSIKRSPSSTQPQSAECVTNCTGAGPCLYKHVRGWMLHHQQSTRSQACKGIRSGR